MQRKVQNEVKTFDQIVKSKKEDFKKKKLGKISQEKMPKQDKLKKNLIQIENLKYYCEDIKKK